MMKKIVLLLLGVVGLMSCSSSDSDGGNNDSGTNSYFPNSLGSYWVYDVVSDLMSGRDSLYVSGNASTNGHVYQVYGVKSPAVGFYSRIMSEGKSRKSGSKVLISSSINIGEVLGEDLGGFGIDFSDFIFFDAQAVQGTILGSKSGEFTVPFNGMNIKAEYLLTTKDGQDLPSFSAHGVSYSEVKTVLVNVKLKISTQIQLGPIMVPFVIMENQDVVSSTQYYAKDVGVVFVETNMGYQLNDLSGLGVTLPIPESMASNTIEALDLYHVNN